MRVFIVCLIFLLTTSSCLKQRTCTCDSYKKVFDDDYNTSTGTPTYSTKAILYQQEMAVAGSEKKAKEECQDQENAKKQQAAELGADVSKVSCKLD